jgi:hypothetical protein
VTAPRLINPVQAKEHSGEKPLDCRDHQRQPLASQVEWKRFPDASATKFRKGRGGKKMGSSDSTKQGHITFFTCNAGACKTTLEARSSHAPSHFSKNNSQQLKLRIQESTSVCQAPTYQQYLPLSFAFTDERVKQSHWTATPAQRSQRSTRFTMSQ